MGIERVEVVAGQGTVIRYGGIVAWADTSASPSLISFLAQSARNLAPSPRGGRQIADHIAGVLANRDPEPNVAFAVIGPSDHGWASLLHGPVQAWDGARWLSPTPSPGWVQAIVTPQPAVTVTRAGTPAPAVQPDSMIDLEAGLVPGGGFVLFPEAVPSTAGGDAPFAAGISATEAMTPRWRDEDVEAPEATAVFTPTGSRDAGAGSTSLAGGTGASPPGEHTTILPALQPTEVLGAFREEPIGAPRASLPPEPSADTELPAEEASAEAEMGVPAEAETDVPAPAEAEVPAAPPREPVQPGPHGSIDLRHVTAPAPQPLPMGAGPDQSVPGAAVVAGVLCHRGHLNRPGLKGCVRCGIRLPEGTMTKASGTRPPLGVLVADDGTIYRLDSAYVVGSDPARDPTVSGGLARPLAIAGEAVSPSHAEVRLHDWEVAVVDRGSAAGTSVYEPGATEWERLKPFEPRLLPAGTHVAFGQRVVTFATPWMA
ncbi:MAG: FHA domain-containing protein [Acidimicrobiales bacterium]